ncbi:MAG TPA: c-type cytochrome [Candidatus Sulfopaludibacter sp.]|jgi:outer membrane lipoprotein-sorting protein|nr:c-type cytochrome [Candidatus Sulfopaludibacter sp.]
MHNARRLGTIIGLAAAGLLTPAASFAQPAAVKPAEEVFKNITELKGTPADQLNPAMQFISASLGVNCDFCHVQGKPEADDKNTKRTARQMMQMTALINKTSFGGRQQITCNSCHNGAQRPVASPPVQDSDAPMRAAAMTPPAAGAGATPQPTVDDILAKYTAAVGGADAMKKVTSRVMKGSIAAGGTNTPIEVFTKAPNLRVTVSHSANGDSFTAFDGKAGWMGNTGRPARDMSPAESGASSLDAEFYLPLRLKEIYPQLRRGRAETIGGVECDVLNGTAPGKPAVRLYFAKNSGLLVRQVRFADTPMGRLPTQIDYADYKEMDGVKTPMRWTLSRPNGRFTIQIADAKNNAPVDDAKFAKPSGEVK